MVATPLASPLVSRKLTRECAPRGSRNSLGNRFTSFPTSLHPSSFHISSSSSLFLLFPFLTAPRTTAKPPYAPSGSYLRVLLIFSYYRRGHVGMFHTHTYICKSSSYVHGVWSISRFTGLPPSYSAHRSLCSSRLPLPVPPRCFSQVLQYVSTLLQRRKRSGRNARESWGVSLAREQRRGETHTRSPGR